MTKNLNLKIWSLLIALATAYWVHSHNTGTVLTLSLPLKLKNLPDEKIVVLPIIKQVQVDMRGPAFAVAAVAQRPPSVVVDLPAGVGSRHVERFQPQNIPLPADIEILRVDPPEIEFVLDELVRRELPVEVSWYGNPPEDFRLKQITVRPGKVEVSGPKTVIQELENIKTQMVDIRSVRTTENRTVAVGNPNTLTAIEPREVSVEIEVISVQKERKFENIPVEIGANGRSTLEVSPQEITVEITGPANIVNQVNAEAIQVLATANPNLPFPQSVDLQVSVPEGVSLVYTNPDKVRLTSRPPGDARSLTPSSEGR